MQWEPKKMNKNKISNRTPDNAIRMHEDEMFERQGEENITQASMDKRRPVSDTVGKGEA
jgi:hypothetical protein